MAEYIDRERLGIGKCNLDVFENKDYAKGWNSVIELLEKAPTEDVAPVKRGEWKFVSAPCCLTKKFKCSVCGEEVYLHTEDEEDFIFEKYPFSHCGADMRKEQK